jgi:transposase
MAARQSAAVDRALRLIEQHGYTAYAAAKKTGIALSTIYRAQKRLRETAQKQ